MVGSATVIGQEQMISSALSFPAKPGKDWLLVLLKHNPPSHYAYAPSEVSPGQVYIAMLPLGLMIDGGTLNVLTI